MAFLTEPEPARGMALDVLPGIRRVVARNPSVMTYWGTNSYLIEHPDGLAVLDPGPDDPQHVEDLLRAAQGRPITAVVITHTHPDHYGAAPALQAATGAASWGFRTDLERGFAPQHGLDDGAEIAGLAAVFTPGHAPDHLSFGCEVGGIGRILFSGDHVMTWSSSVVSPPEGDMLAYCNSLERLLRREDEIFLPGHGPLTREPRRLVGELLRHRKARELEILNALHAGPQSVEAIAARLYTKTDRMLRIAAQRNTLAHLQKLEQEGKAAEIGEPEPLPEEPRVPEWLAFPGRAPSPRSMARAERDARRCFALPG